MWNLREMKLTKIKEEKVHKAILDQIAGEESIEISDTEINLEIDSIDVHGKDSPDIILWINVSFEIFNRKQDLRIPLPVEAEAGGISSAVEDLDKFVDRNNYEMELPMPVIGGKGTSSKKIKKPMPVTYRLSQIPERYIDY